MEPTIGLGDRYNTDTIFGKANLEAKQSSGAWK
jgi:hypothetical protein